MNLYQRSRAYLLNPLELHVGKSLTLCHDRQGMVAPEDQTIVIERIIEATGTIADGSNPYWVAYGTAPDESHQVAIPTLTSPRGHLVGWTNHFWSIDFFVDHPKPSPSALRGFVLYNAPPDWRALIKV